ncbi:hypothetical protein ScPMuIL_018072 [Solemya velum]
MRLSIADSLPISNRKSEEFKVKANFDRSADDYCFVVMRGYSYAGILDFDELVIPKTSSSLKEFLVREFENNPRAGGHLMPQELFLSEINATTNNETRGFADFLYRTNAIHTRRKGLYQNNRTRRVSTHRLYLKKGYKGTLRPQWQRVVANKRSNFPPVSRRRNGRGGSSFVGWVPSYRLKAWQQGGSRDRSGIAPP